MKNINIFIIKYNNVSFKDLKNVFIAQRSSNLTEVIYMVGKFGGKQPLYFATYSRSKKVITNINDAYLRAENVPDYFTHAEIRHYIEIIRKYDFYLLAMDSDKNLYVNPYYYNEPPLLLRLNTEPKDSTVRKGYVYELYKGNWYLNKTRTKK
jgi:hypothetical protein